MLLSSRPVADENDVSAVKFNKPGHGLHGVKDSARHAFGRTLGKPSLLAPTLGKSSTSNHQRVRTALGDLTNSSKPSAASADAPVKSARAAPGNPLAEPIEKIAGKTWAAIEQELLRKEDAALEERLNRVAAAASHWTAGYLTIRDDEVNSDSDSDSDSEAPSLSERYEEAPIVVQLLAPRGDGTTSSLRPSKAIDLFPDVPDISLDLEFCWSDDDELSCA